MPKSTSTMQISIRVKPASVRRGKEWAIMSVGGKDGKRAHCTGIFIGPLFEFSRGLKYNRWQFFQLELPQANRVHCEGRAYQRKGR